MRRPLFWVALLLVIVAAVRLESGGLDSVPEGMVSALSLGVYQELTVTGQVYKKDDQTFYLQDISVHLQNSSGSEDPLQTVVSQAGASRQNISCKDNIICKLVDVEEIPLGSYVTLKGSFAPISPATNPGEFDAAAYYQTIGVGGRLSRAVLLARDRTRWPVREWLYSLRLRLEKRIYSGIPEGQAGILCALLLGDRGGLEEKVEDLYRQSGILHILSISSLHITILGMSLYQLLRRLRVPVLPSAFMGSMVLLLYGGLTGFGVSACRAIGMYLIRMLGEVLGRTYDMLTALGVMAALMVWRNPYYLHHSGFLLSYASVLGVGVLCPALTELGRRVKGLERAEKGVRRLAREVRERLWQSAVASVSVILATLPVQLWYYYEVPVYSVLINVLVLPFVKPLMLTGFLVMLIPQFVLPRMVAGAILKWYEWLCEMFGRLPFHTWNPGCPRLWQIVVYYLALGMVVFLREKLRATVRFRKEQGSAARSGSGVGDEAGVQSRKRFTGTEAISQHRQRLMGTEVIGLSRLRLAGASLAAMDLRHLKLAGDVATMAALACTVLLLGLRPVSENKVTFLDVGQGDCVLMQTRSGENYLFDCGSTSRTGVGEYVLLPFLKYNGIRMLDAVFVSHPDEDHANGILELLDMEGSGVEIRMLVLPDIAEGLWEEHLEQLLSAAREARRDQPVAVRYISAGDVWECGSARFICLNPVKGWNLKNTNAYSECFFVEFFWNSKSERVGQEAVTLLLTGDVEGEGEEALMEQLEIRGIAQIDILKVAHHGSRGATSAELLEMIHPRISVISCGRNNRYGHPHQELLDRLRQVESVTFLTPESGALSFRFSGERILVEAFGAGR